MGCFTSQTPWPLQPPPGFTNNLTTAAAAAATAASTPLTHIEPLIQILLQYAGRKGTETFSTLDQLAEKRFIPHLLGSANMDRCPQDQGPISDFPLYNATTPPSAISLIIMSIIFDEED